ncbi:MAG: hypothetical protein IKP65_02295 [Alphaproteobacteria bacterium]|nr:hypothetical protein [Alphaproteobacteria bacterium]
MTATVDWLDASKTISKYRLVYDSYIGSPVYANAEGMIIWKNKRTYTQNGGVIKRKSQPYIYKISEWNI